MHDEIVGLQLFKIEQRALGGRAPAPMRSRLAENVLFAVDVETVRLQNDAGRNLPFHDRGAIVRPFKQRRQTLAFEVDFKLPRLQMTAQTRRLMRPVNDHQRTSLPALDFAQLLRQRLEARRRPLGAQLVRPKPQARLRLDLDRRRPALARRYHRHQRAGLDRGEVCERAFERLRPEEQRIRRRMKRGLARRGCGLGGHSIGEAICLGHNPPRIDQPQQRARRDVIEHAVERAPVRIRHQQFRARKQQPVLERLGQFRRLLAHHADLGGPQRGLLAQLGILQRSGRQVASAGYRRLRQFAARALAMRVEMANRSDQVVFELDPNRVAVQRRERIDDSAAHAEVARLFALRHALIAAPGERFDQRLEIQPIANRNFDDRFVEDGARNRARHQRFGRGKHQRRLMPKHREQRRQLRRLHVGRRRQLRHRFHFPRADQMHPARGGVGVRRLAKKKPDLPRQRLGLRRS